MIKLRNINFHFFKKYCANLFHLLKNNRSEVHFTTGGIDTNSHIRDSCSTLRGVCTISTGVKKSDNDAKIFTLIVPSTLYSFQI